MNYLQTLKLISTHISPAVLSVLESYRSVTSTGQDPQIWHFTIQLQPDGENSKDHFSFFIWQETAQTGVE